MSQTNTVTLQWPRESDFVDYQTDQRYEGSGVYEVPARLEQFYRTRGWEDPPEDYEDEPEQPTSALNRNLETATRDELVGDETDSTDDADEGGGAGN